MSLQDQLITNHLLHQSKLFGNESIAEQREQALQVFEQKGFPNKKLEDWKYTNIRPLLELDYELFPSGEKALEYSDVKKYLLHDVDSYRIVFINGVYSSYLSQTTHDEADICVLSSATQKQMHYAVIENYLHKIADNEQNMVALNTAYARDGAYIYIPAKTILSRPVQVIYFSSYDEKEVMHHTRNLVVLGDHSQAQIIERHQTLNHKANLTNSVTEIHLGKNAHLDYYKIQNDSTEASIVDSTFINQERDSVGSVHTFSMGGKVIRNELNFHQKGENCNSILKGVSIGEDDQLIDHHTRLEHMMPNCESHELYRTVLGGNAKGVFNGKVIVDKDAQKIDAFQQNNNILLSDSASIDTKPQLEIFADDVKCSHGCTVGQLDEDAMFYLQSRGIPKKEAQALLLYAFSADVLATVKIQSLKNKINGIIAEKLGVNLDF